MSIPAAPFLSLHRLLTAARADDTVVCYGDDHRIVWSEFRRRVGASAAALRSRTEARWVLSAANAYQFALGFFSLLAAGKQVVIPHNTQPGTLEALADAYDARWEQSKPTADAAVFLSEIDLDEAVIDLFTSGSTGQPKRIRKTLAHLEAEVEVLERVWGERLGGAPVIATVPCHHIYGLLFRVLWPLASGRPFDAHTCAQPDEIEERLRFIGPATLVSSPAHLVRLPELVSLSRFRYRLTTIFSSGGALPTESSRSYAKELGQSPLEIFGSTETGGIAWRCQGEAESDGWAPFPGIEVRRAQNGALSLRSPYLPDDSYWQMDDAIDWLPGGRFRLLGRLDRVVKIEEKRLSLPDMESRLAEHPWVTAAAVVPVMGHRQVLGVVVEVNGEGREAMAHHGKRYVVSLLRDCLAQYFEPVLLPRRWRFPERMPVDERGKTSQSILAALFVSAAKEAFSPLVERVQRETGSEARVRIAMLIPPSLEHFAGHFPGMPILPGVVQVDWAIRFCREYLGVSGDFLSLENVKFTALILPGALVELSLDWNAANGRLEFAYTGGERAYSKGRVVFGGHA
ncbi:AMP-binding protein [Propionivibrio soli]|uniref:AMP-binding protein n=1 Tax=Propionivibrio soli TaxID=2976531 RepID=UPI0021E9A54B|nr:AMP-binding protein [Propionivibrio soli]